MYVFHDLVCSSCWNSWLNTTSRLDFLAQSFSTNWRKILSEQDDQGNLLVTEFGSCEFRDHQTLSIREMPENSVPGQLPRSIDVIVEDDLVDVCKPGNRVAIVGIYKAIPGENKGSMNGVFRLIPLQSFYCSPVVFSKNMRKWSMAIMCK